MNKYQVMPPLTTEEYEALKADIAEHGVQVPVEYDEEGNVLDGYHREQICRELGTKDFPYFIRRGLTEEEKKAHARRLNIVRRHLNQEQKRELIRQQLKETPEKSDRQIAAGLGVNHETVGIQRKEMESRGEIRHVKEIIDSIGRKQPKKKPSNPIYGAKEKHMEAITAILDKAKEGDERAEKELEKLEKGQITVHSAHKRYSPSKRKTRLNCRKVNMRLFWPIPPGGMIL